MNKHLYEMLKKSAEADQAKARLSLDFLGTKGVGIGDHSTDDLWNDAEKALVLLESATSRLETLEHYYGKSK